MSLFRKPKKIQRRVFLSAVEEDDEAYSGGNSGKSLVEPMDLEAENFPHLPSLSLDKKKDKNKDVKKTPKFEIDTKNIKKTLLSFADDEDDAEVFQVRKSSHSKKVMRMLDKERRRRKKEEHVSGSQSSETLQGRDCSENGRSARDSYNLGSSSSKYESSSTSSSSAAVTTTPANEKCKSKKTHSVQTEIRTDDFVLVVKKSEPNVILNGRAALCFGRDDISDEEEDEARNKTEGDGELRFSKPEHLKQMLESGSIPNAAMIHDARKRRQKARERRDYMPVEEPKEVAKKVNHLVREDIDGDHSDDEERVDMNAITGIKEREERREKFYSVQNNYSDDDSEHETHEWENQQIRKGVTGAQLVSAQNDSVLSRFMIKHSSHVADNMSEPLSTSSLLEQAYAKSSLEKPQLMLVSTKLKKDKSKVNSLRSPQEIRTAISLRLTNVKKLNNKHSTDFERITNELQSLKVEQTDYTNKAPIAAAKYRFYQEVKFYVTDLVDCLNEKTPLINDLEKRILLLLSKHQNCLIERRRQDMRDQAKEMSEVSRPPTVRPGPEYEEQKRRAAEREGRRTRRRCEREKQNLLASHLDGMSSDEETSDRYQEQLKSNLEQLLKEGEDVFIDVNDEFCKVEIILKKFYAWRKTDMDSYKDAFVSLCLPKILGPLMRLEMVSWSPLLEEFKDIEKMNWYTASMLYAWSEHETVESLRSDPDVNIVPVLIEKIILPKLTEHANKCWDPLSTTQSLRLIGFINRLGRDYPLKETSKSLQQLFNAILDKMKLALENDVFIPIFPKQVQEAKTSFFQRQFCSGLKLFRNFLSWQGIIADKPLRELAIGSLLNRYLMMAMRVCNANDAISKGYIVVNTLPTVWLQPGSETFQSLQLFTTCVKQTLEGCDAKNPLFIQTSERAKQILQRLHSF